VIAGLKTASGQILRADLAAQGLGDATITELFCEGVRLPVARYPNFVPDNPYGGGWAFADGKPAPMYEDQPGEDRVTLRVHDRDLRAWAHPEEVEVFVFPRYNWWNNIERVKTYDRGSKTVTLARDCSYPIRPGDRYYFRNAREELDAPGEWYFDPREKALYVWPSGPSRRFVAPVVETLVRVEPGTKFLTIRGLTLEACTGEAVAMNDAEDCTLAACTIRGVGDYHRGGVSVSGGLRNRVVGCDVSDTGSHGVSIGGGDRVSLTPAGNQAINNYIHHIGVLYKHGVGVNLSGVGNRAANNLIHDGPRMGIMFYGNNLLIENNHIRHMNLETEDTGAVYTGGRDWLGSRGTVIRNNLFHDMLGFGKDAQGRWVSPHFAWGVYLDDNTGGVDVIGNIVYRCSRAGLHLHNARDNNISNNVFAENGQYQYEYSGWTGASRMWKEHFGTMVAGYEKVAASPAWRSMRNMRLHPKDAIRPDDLVMTGNRFERNVVSYSSTDASLLRTNNVPFDANVFDFNVVWHGGRPVRTGVRRPGADLSKNLAPNPGFDRGEPGSMPADWQWQIHPEKARAGLVSEGGKKALRIDAAYDESKPRDNYPIVVSKEIVLTPGSSYRLSARFKADRPGATASLMLQGYEANRFFWANWPNEVKVGTDWTRAEFVFTIPAPGEKGYDEHMKNFRARVDFADKSGSILVDDVSLVAVAMLDEWASWRSLGVDEHSIEADPKFVDPTRDDYRLRPDSPALKMGFEPIAVEKIGPYPDDLRASWPIVEAPGTREHPIRVPMPE
jgi:parallel beta-helix repeat protein